MKMNNSKFLKNIIRCLNENRHSHMLKRRGDLEFEITYKHMRDSTWKRNDISLFMEMDKLYKPKRQLDTKFCEQCKNRFKANIRKLCGSGVLKEEEFDESDTNVKKSIKKRRYKFMKMYDELHAAYADKTAAKKDFLVACMDIEVEENANDLSHFLCLSDNANDAAVELNASEKQEVGPLSLFERRPSSQKIAEDSVLHSYVECSRSKEMEIFFKDVEHQPLLLVVRDDHEIQNKVIVLSDHVQHQSCKETEVINVKGYCGNNVKVVSDMLGETEESIDLNAFLKRHEFEESQGNVENKSEIRNSSDPFLPSVWEANRLADEAVSSSSEFKMSGSAFSFSQSEDDILSMYG